MTEIDSKKSENRFKNWNQEEEKLFDIAVQFYKNNEGKAFQSSFELRNLLSALICQAKFGDLEKASAPEVGTLDFVGKSRRNEWCNLQGVSKKEAMSKFICIIDELCPLFEAHAEAIKLSSNLLSNNSTSENNKPAANKTELYENIYSSLCKQTLSQFECYAQQQYPDNVDEQKKFVTHLQEQYYKQYIQTINQGSNPETTNTDTVDNVMTSSNTAELPNDEPKQNILKETDYDQTIPPVQSSSSSVTDSSKNLPHEHSSSDVTLKTIEESKVNNVSSSPQHYSTVEIHGYNNCNQINEEYFFSQVDLNPPNVDHGYQIDQYKECNYSNPRTNNNENVVESSHSYNNEGYEHSQSIEHAIVWTKKGVEELKSLFENDTSICKDIMPNENNIQGILEVKSSNTSVIQVPTLPEGKYIYWEFVSDGYDISFGLQFKYDSCNTDRKKSVQIIEIDDDDSDDERELITPGTDPELGLSSSSNNDLNNYQDYLETLTIITSYRRDSHEDVIMGRHKYPGQGYYLLRFDNTYSLFRAKTIYYRICHLI